MVYPRIIDPRRIVVVEEARAEAPGVKSILFRDKLSRGARPGQYLMVWIPGLDEIPLSLSMIDSEGLSAVTVKEVGDATRALCEMGEGDSIGLRGPYGNWFKPVKGRVAIVGGGTGLAPLLPLVKELIELGSLVSFIAGGKTKDDLLFLPEIRNLLDMRKHRLIATTEDGSYGRRGTAFDAFKNILGEGSFDMVYSCGPEIMMRGVFDLAEERGLQVQVCVERIIRCSIGLCGSCVIGKFRVCKDGLVLSSWQLREVSDEFGRYKRGFDGRKTYL